MSKSEALKRAIRAMINETVSATDHDLEALHVLFEEFDYAIKYEEFEKESVGNA